MRNMICPLVGVCLWATVAAGNNLDAVMHRVYSFDFAAGQTLAAEAVARDGQDPLAPAVLAAAHLFAELDRLQLLNDGLKGQKPAGRRPDPDVRRRMQQAIAETIRRAEQRLVGSPGDADALTALMLVHGAERDYLALVEKSYRTSWISARQAQAFALRLLATHPDRQDAWFTVGFSDYLIASAPFLVRPFMKMEQADGDRQRGIRNLEKAAAGGRYLRGFARILLVNIYRKEGRQAEASRMLRELAREYPVNKTLQRELGDAGL